MIRKEQISQILFGEIFSQARILNFIEEDFFTWFFYPTLRKESTEIMYKLLQQLVVYDLNKIDEDVLKELYQELVDPDQRKLLGEFYTPDWLAELTIEEVLKDNPMLSIMDPTCGSGTFLFKSIRYKIDALSKKGLAKPAILSHILENVIGFDVHPLAVTIAKTNYLLSLKDLLGSRISAVTIPVYLSDTLKLPQISQPRIDKPVTSFEYQAINDKKFVFPVSVAGNLSTIDNIIEKMRSHAHEYEIIVTRSKGSQQNNKEQLRLASNNLMKSFERSIATIEQKEEREVIM